MLWAAACTEKNLCADPTLLNSCILRSGWLMGILRSIVAPSTETRHVPFAPWSVACCSSVVGAGDVPGRLEQEPRAPLGLVDPHLQKTRRRNVTIRVADVVHLAH